MYRILNIQDDTSTQQSIVPTLCSTGFTVDVARSGREGMAKVMACDYDVVVIERRLPDLDGVTIVTAMRSVGIETPVIVLSSTSSVEERIRGLRAGCDAYLIRPFSFAELLARVEAFARRSTCSAAIEAVLCVGPLKFDLIKREFTCRGNMLRLRPTELRLLEFMMRHAGQVLTRSMIRERVWNGHVELRTNLLAVQICRLRNRIDVPGEPSLIRTIRGAGYLLAG